jgi:hypothetical protein
VEGQHTGVLQCRRKSAAKITNAKTVEVSLLGSASAFFFRHGQAQYFSMYFSLSTDGGNGDGDGDGDCNCDGDYFSLGTDSNKEGDDGGDVIDCCCDGKEEDNDDAFIHDAKKL